MDSARAQRIAAANIPDRAWVMSLLAAALLYPLVLRSAYGSMNLYLAAGSRIAKWSDACVFVLSMAAAYAVPALGLLIAWRLKTVTAGRATSIRRLAHLAFAAPPLFTGLGVITYILGVSELDIPIWAFCCVILGIYCTRSVDVQTYGKAMETQPARLRYLHGSLALAVLLMFLLAHLANHVLALWSIRLHEQAMQLLENVYRQPLIEPLLVILVIALVTSGFRLAWRATAAPQDAHGVLQTLTGFFVGLFILSHLTAVFVMARMVLHIPTDWAFASGAPVGLLADPWNVRLIPHYSIAVWAVLSHLGLGIRLVLRSHQYVASVGDAAARIMIGLGALTSVLITAALLGVHGAPS